MGGSLSSLSKWPIMGSALTQAIKTVDLPGLVDESFPGARDARNRVHPVWRDPNTKDRDAALRRYPNGWLLTDFGLARSFNAYGFLVELVGLERQPVNFWPALAFRINRVRVRQEWPVWLFPSNFQTCPNRCSNCSRFGGAGCPQCRFGTSRTPACPWMTGENFRRSLAGLQRA